MPNGIKIEKSEKTMQKEDRETRIAEAKDQANPTNKELLNYINDRMDKIEELIQKGV